MTEPAPIKKLDESVINRIAAGEVIQRPANALKEMLENSIDAGSTNIQVVVKEGGLKFLQIIDNGCGIRKEDFEIVCDRFTTSKLQKFEDLSSIGTYGFRGEALASISHVAHLTIQSKTADSDCAYRASYVDSRMKDGPHACAGNQGTIITVEDLFYNMATRKRALKNASEEFRRVWDVVARYAVHNAAIGFVLKKYGEHNAIKTSAGSTTEDNIRTLYGAGVARELLRLELQDEALGLQASGCVTGVNYSARRPSLLLFINQRLVESATLRRALNNVYSTYLPRNTHPFLYLSLQLDPATVDVNVHPTKHQVHFLHEEQVVERLAAALDALVLSCGDSRRFYTQSKLPVATAVAATAATATAGRASGARATPDARLVRTCAADQKLDRFVVAGGGGGGAADRSVLDMSGGGCADSSARCETRLTSVLQLRIDIQDGQHQGLRELLSQLVFVGCVDARRALVQHCTGLYLCDTRRLAAELFYQLLLHNFQNLGTITFSQPLSLRRLATIGLDLPAAGWTASDGPKDRLADRITEVLSAKADMLLEYFSFKIDPLAGNLLQIPLLLENHCPETAGLPMYLLRLATEVDWSQERQCFIDFARETALYYSTIDDANTMENSNWKWTVEHVLYPAIKKYLLPPKSFAENAAILQIADLPDLYKVFERC